MRTRPPHTLSQPKPTSSSSTSRLFGAPLGGCLPGGKSGFESIAYIPIFGFGKLHSGSGKWLRSTWRGKRGSLGLGMTTPCNETRRRRTLHAAVDLNDTLGLGGDA